LCGEAVAAREKQCAGEQRRNRDENHTLHDTLLRVNVCLFNNELESTSRSNEGHEGWNASE